MADVQKDIVLRVKAESEQATGQFKNLKQELRSIEGELNRMAESGDTGSEAFRKLQQRAGQVKDQIGDTKSAIKSLSSDTFKLDAFTQAAQGIAGGFAAAQGAMALFGSENQAVEEAIKKTQGAMALLQGVTAITNILQKETAFSQLFLSKAQKDGAVATEVATKATKGFGMALKGLGIGLLIGALTYLIANFEDVKKVVMNLLKPFDGIIAKVRDFLHTISFGLIDDASTAKTKENAEESLKAIEKVANYNKSMEKQLQRNIDLAKAKGKTDKEILQLEKELLDFRLKNNYAEQDAIKRKMALGTATDEEKKKLFELVESARDLVKDRETLDINYQKGVEKRNEDKKQKKKKNDKKEADEEKKKYDDSIKANEAYYAHLIATAQLNDQETETLEIQKLEKQLEIDTKYGKDTIALADQIALKKKEIKDKEAEEIKTLEDKERQLSLDADRRYLDDSLASERLTLERKLQLNEEYYLNGTISEQEYLENIKKLKKDQTDYEDKLRQQDIEAQKTSFDLTIESTRLTLERKKQLLKEYYLNGIVSEKEYNEAIQKLELTSAQKRKEIFDFIVRTSQQTFSNILAFRENQMNQELQMAKGNEKEQEKIRKEYFERNKKVQIAEAIIQAIAGAQGAFTQTAKSPITSVFPAAPYIAAASAIATGLANVQKIRQSQYQGGSAPSSSKNAPNLSPSNQATQTSGLDSTQLQLDAQGNLMQQRTMRTYVLETDISAKQQRSKRLQQTATLGK